MSNRLFGSILAKRPRYNNFDLSHERKMSLNMADLVPMYVQDVLPGDKFRVSAELLLRFAPLVAPTMHRVNVTTHFYYVPKRLLFNDWEKFITGGEDGLQQPVFPTIPMSQANKSYFLKGTLADYMGLPTLEEFTGSFASNMPVSALPFRAYQMIYNEYYRDQNLTPPIDFALGSDPSADYDALLTMRRRAWEKDYFTSALPFSQRGAEVELPITSTFSPTYKDPSETADAGGLPVDGALSTTAGQVTGPGGPLRVENLEDTQNVDATSVTINELRQAVKLQQWLERNARAGVRYTETLFANWGLKSSDARLQRPEYLGGGKSPVVISEVLQTAATVVSGTTPHENVPPSPQGNMAGHGISVGNSNRFTRKFEEHGYIIGIMSVLPRTAYQQGVERHWLKHDKLDFYWPDFAQLGEQEVQQQELYLNPELTSVDNRAAFGYQSRYAEYKYKQSSVHGDFRDNLSQWHLGRRFTTDPALNTTFIEADPDTRIFAVDDGELPTEQQVDKLYVQIYNNIRAMRAMPYFNTPSL